jgi:undecaprenyl-diphosphatase
MTVLLLTQLGGARVTIALALAPLALAQWQPARTHGLWTLVLSHIAVQIIKRFVGRERPSGDGVAYALIREPDRFSFPSGHAASSFSIALAYALLVPSLSIPLFALAGLVGVTRVLVGVHYPGDVAAGQSIAVLTHWLLLAAGA